MFIFMTVKKWTITGTRKAYFGAFRKHIFYCVHTVNETANSFGFLFKVIT